MAIGANLDNGQWNNDETGHFDPSSELEPGGGVPGDTGYNLRKAARNNQADFNQQTAAQQGKMQNFLDSQQGKQAPTVAQGDLNKYAGADAGTASHANAAYLGPANQSNYQTLANAHQMNAAASQGTDVNQQFRQGQVGLMSQLQAQANGTGPSLAAGQMRQAQDRNLSQQAGLAAAQGGRNAAAVQRGLAMQASQTNQQTNSDVAQLRLQEQISAQQQLAGVTNAGRGSDLSESGLAQNNQQFNAANQQSANQFNANAQNAQNLNQFQANQQNAQFNASAKNQYGLQQGQFNQQNSQFNAQQNQQMAQYNASNQQQAGLANAQAGNQALLANQQANLQQQGLTNQLSENIYGQQSQLMENNQQQAMDYDKMLSQQALGYANMNSQQNMNYLNKEGNSLDQAQKAMGIGSSMLGGAAAAMSDKNAKKSINRGEDKLVEFLNQYNASSMSDENIKNIGPKSDNFDLNIPTAKASDSQSGGGSSPLSGAKFNMSTSEGADGSTATSYAASASDRHDKKNIKSEDESKINGFLSSLKAYEYSYKNPEMPGRGEGRFVSPMAQDLEKTDLGSSAVKETPQGKMVDYGKLGGVMLAALAMENKRLNKLEEKKGK